MSIFKRAGIQTRGRIRELSAAETLQISGGDPGQTLTCISKCGEGHKSKSETTQCLEKCTKQ